MTPSAAFYSCEDDSRPIGKSYFNAGWARQCFGEAFLALVANKCIINSGSIFASPAVLQMLAVHLSSSCPQTSEVFHGRDQTRLNWLEYTGKLADVSRVLQRRGHGIVNTLRYVPPTIRKRHLKRRWNHDPTEVELRALHWPHELPFQVFNLDHTVSPVVHQYDTDQSLMDLMDRVALAHRRNTSRY